jgi:hypothetical protein
MRTQYRLVLPEVASRQIAIGSQSHSSKRGDGKVFKKPSPMKLQMKREALCKFNRHANEQNVDQSGAMNLSYDTARVN